MRETMTQTLVIIQQLLNRERVELLQLNDSANYCNSDNNASTDLFENRCKIITKITSQKSLLKIWDRIAVKF
jgi:hypothetical protein